MNKRNIIDAIVSRDTLSLRRLTGKLDGVPVLCYLDDNYALKMHDRQGNLLKLETPSTIEAWEAFLTMYNVIHFSSFDKLREFICDDRKPQSIGLRGCPLGFGWSNESKKALHSVGLFYLDLPLLAKR